ncbi:hypothetical protein PsorP6_016910 [Peronosclerospora sorghi]|uniref:Uncharacterized protein n=1 Tax=Peronosclerospora sorghi TaxID=230839 RepID=A0ACC0WBN3_9STRA|nr:hypothetical protein PsorP6_016910 [Peronosclerospora sorghi]
MESAEELEPPLHMAVENPRSDLGPIDEADESRTDGVQLEGTRVDAEAWGTSDDEDGWMPKPARLHFGRTRSCAVCYARLQYTKKNSWDEYLQSEEYLDQLQANVLQDAFISTLICGENTAGDLPTEHRMHKNRKQKCRQNVTDYWNMTSAGVVDKSGTEKGSIRTLEEMLIEALPTPVFTHVLERRLAVISHSSKIARDILSCDGKKKIPLPTEKAPGNEELHHLAIHTLSALLGTFDYTNPRALKSFEELSQILTCFPVLSLYSFWSPMKKPPDKVLMLVQDAVEASSVTTSDGHVAHCAVDGIDATFWQSLPRPGVVYFVVKTDNLEKVTSISISWHMKYTPQMVGIQYRPDGSDSFVQMVEDRTVAPSGPTVIETKFPKSTQEARIVMAGTPSSNRNGMYAIEHLRLNIPASNSLFTDPKSTLGAVAEWLLGALDSANEVMAAEAIGALRAWALATASLNVTMLFVKMLLLLNVNDEDRRRRRIATLAFEQGKHLLKGINAYRQEKKREIADKSEKAGLGDVRKVTALFESSVCSTGVVVEDGGLAVRTCETSYQYAAVNCGVSTGKASWKFRLDSDTQDDEMTCFGAAILPVTVNGYDSSPSLWMLRGYNGNLYARGHKLGRTIGKVHPGDIVQVDVDMSEGTLAYKINGTDYGVVFTDLAGYEVHPAVSFYGSGKVISLLGLTKSDCISSDSADFDPVFLSSMKEYHYSVGYGTLGKGDQLGYAGNGNPDAYLSNETASSGSTSIRVNGELKRRCLSTHPPSNGSSYVMYDLSEAYETVSGAVAINDDSPNEILQNRGVSVVFQIYGDEKLLWQSKAMSTTYLIEQFEVNVRNMRMLELRVVCQGCNYCAHAIWVNPCLHPVKDWACSNCSFTNHGSAKVCTVCKNSITDKKSINMDDRTLEEALSELKPSVNYAVKQPESQHELCTTIIHQIYDLCHFQSESLTQSMSCVKFEEPFCRQPSKEVFSLLLIILQQFRANYMSAREKTSPNGSATKHTQDACVSILGIIRANLESIACHDVEDPAVELGMSIELVTALRGELEEIARIRETLQTFDDAIEYAAAQTIVTGLVVLYPSPIEKLELLRQMLLVYLSFPFDAASASYFVLSSVPKLLSTPGPNGILTFMPFMAAETAKRTESSDLKVNNEATWTSVVTEVLELLMQVVMNAHRKQLTSDTDCTTLYEADRSRDQLSYVAIHLLKVYQLYLLSEAVELTKTSVKEDTSDNRRVISESKAINKRRLQVQEATIRFGFLSLSAHRDLARDIVAYQAEESFLLPSTLAACQASVRSYKIPLLFEVLPWFVACLCLLRRQTWLARPILPVLVNLLGTLDHLCSESHVVSKSAHRFQQLEAYQKARLIESQEVERAAAPEKDPKIKLHTSKRLYNIFHQLYTGEKDHFEGQIGFQFEATSSFTIVALGRSVNPNRHNGRLSCEHTIRLWEEASRQLLTQISVGGNSKKDALGYALEMLPFPVKVIQGKLYRLTTQEFANGGDPWYKKENLPDEEYDESLIKILRDCYASGSEGFPGSQNMISAAYGVPTFLVEDETPLASLPQFVPPHGCLSLRFDSKKKVNSVCVSHTGTSAYVKDSTDAWRTCLLRTAFLHGVHSVDFDLKCSRAGGAVSGHVCLGIDWRQPHEDSHFNFQVSAFESFLGETNTSIGWMPSIGSVWVKGTRYDYGPKLLVAGGDTFTIVIDYDLQLLSFAYNGNNLGVAVGPKTFHPLGTTMEKLPPFVTAGVSLYGSQDVFQVRPSGIAQSSLCVHWLFDLHNSLASLGGRIASTLIAGHPIDGVEEELLPWLQSPLLSGGIAESSEPFGVNAPLLWNEALQADCAPYLTNSQETDKNGSWSNIAQHMPSSVEQGDRKRSVGRRLENSEALDRRDAIFWEKWTIEMTERGTVAFIMSWLEHHYPDRTFLSKLGKFPSCERWMCAALIMHAPSHVLQEVQAIAALVGSSTADEVGKAEFFAAHADLTPSDDLIRVWKRIIMLRHWLIKVRQGYRAKRADESSLESPGSSELSSMKSMQTSMNALGDAPPPKRLCDTINLENSVVIPKTFEDLLKQVIQRAAFLCKLAPPSEVAEHLKGDSQLALSNLAEKWSAQKTPPSLQPMLERWKTLGEADSSKWSGIVDVLRAQHRWRARRASLTIDVDSEEMSEDLLDTKKYDYTDSFTAMMKACELYIRDGIGAPPEVLTLLLERRQRRSNSRLFGLQAMKSIISMLSYDSAIHNALIFLRPAMRGFTESEKESRELNDGQVVAETFRATVRHHYLKGLEGCNRESTENVQRAFCDLYTYLAQLLSGNSGYSVSDPQLKQAILCAWSLDFEPRDHKFLLDTGMLPKLQEIFSITSILRDAIVDYESISNEAMAHTSLREYTHINWHPLSEELVRQGLLRSGYLTKRDVIRLLRRAPHYACSDEWWRKHELKIADETIPLTECHTASSLSLAYADMLAELKRKLLGHPLGVSCWKVLMFGEGITSPTVRRSLTSAHSKVDDVSYVDMPALGATKDFTIEMWIFATELIGTQALRCDHGIQNGSVYLELIGRHLQLSIPGNSPRERLFRTYTLRTYEWTHCAVTYDTTTKCTELIVNGILAESMAYERVCSVVNFRPGRLGCWMSGVDINGAVLTDLSSQHKFKGSIAELRIWRIARTDNEIRTDFQRSIPLVRHSSDLSDAKGKELNNNLIGLWHLTEGEGIYAYDCLPVQRGRTEFPEGERHNLTISNCRWISTNLPVFENEILNAMSSNRWRWTMLRIRWFQRRIRSWLRTQFRESVRLTKVACEHEERRALQRWNHLARTRNDSGDIEVLNDGFSYLSGGNHEREEVGSQQLDTLTNEFVSFWNFCSDEQLIIRKQTRKCAWVVFRFLASTGISGARERREGEAMSVAAIAKMRRKLRVQQSSSSGNVDASLAQNLSSTDEDIAARTAEAASDAAKNAATNRELDKPGLQTLWFSIEFHRKVFEVLEKEIIQGKELTEKTEGLTRAQRMLRSVSTPVRKRGASLRQYPSDVARAESGFVATHSAPSDLAGDHELLESLEVERHMFDVILFLLSQSQQSSTINYLVRPPMLRGLLEMLRLASPRIQRVVKLLIRRLCCSGSVKPSDVGDILGSESVLIDLLLDQVAESVCSTAAPMATHSVNVPASGAQVGWADKTNVMTFAESLSNPIGFRSGEISLIVASESVALLRYLLMEKSWKRKVSENLCSAIRNITPLLAKRKLDPVSGTISERSDPSDIRFRAAIIRAVGALCVLGTHSDCMRIGGKVAVTAQGASRSEADLIANKNGHAVSATIIELHSHAAEVRVVFHPAALELNFDPSHNIQDVNLSTLSPIEEIFLSPAAVPLTMDMMPVILQLSSLEDSSVLNEFDNLWRLQIRSRALLALEALLRHSVPLTKNLAYDVMAPNLLRIALTPINMNTFISLPLLQERGRMIMCRLIESLTPLGEAMFHGLQEPTAPAITAFDEETPTNSSCTGTNDNPLNEETEARRVRRGFASTLAGMGFEFDLCMAALEHSRDDPNLAVEWLMGDGAVTYQERLEAQRLARGNIMACDLGDEATRTFGRTIEAEATELESISGMPFDLAFCALELSNNDPNRAMEWLMEHGHAYLDKLVLLTDQFKASKTVVLEDRAAIEEIDQPDPLVISPQDALVVEHFGPGAPLRGTDASSSVNADAMAVALAPILAQMNSGGAGRDTNATAFAPLDPDYLTPNVLLTATTDIGPVEQLATSGRTGIFRRCAADESVLLTFLNTESGAYEDEWFSARDLRRIDRIFDEPLGGVESIHRVAIRTEDALSTFYARRAITALLSALASATEAPRLYEGDALEEKFSFSSNILSVVRGPSNFVSLLKMVLASEMNVNHCPEDGMGGVLNTSQTSSTSVLDSTGQPVSLLTSLQTITLRILREEARTEKLETLGVLSSTRRVRDPCSHHLVPIYDGGKKEEPDVNHAHAFLSQESMAPSAASSKDFDVDAPEVASVDCLASKDSVHAGLLSSVLVTECVNHFVESTRMAGDAENEISVIQEFQSLHPYFGRCEYARAVIISSTYRCLRIVFDQRCRFGPNSKLTFFADPECEERIATIDHTMTTSGHAVPDLIIPSHQFWFRFTAAEDHRTATDAYGYRFQVKHMANFCWTKESEVLTSPSLKWACWILELLLNNAKELVAHGAVHNQKIYGALVRYLRSPGAPFKSRIVRLVQQLLHQPELFPVDEIPNLEALDSISRLALTCAEVDRASGKVFLSGHLLQLVELSMMISSASSVFDHKLAGTCATSVQLSPPPYEVPAPFEQKCVRESLNDVSLLTKFLLGHATRLPEHILLAIWLEVYGSCRIIESSHPYAPGMPITSRVTFEGAVALLLTFDPRSSLAPGQGPSMSRLELTSFNVRDDGAGNWKKEISSKHSYAGEAGWPNDTITYEGNTLEFSFHADENAGAHFGFAATVSAVGIPKEKQVARASAEDLEKVLDKLVVLQTGSDDASGWSAAMDSQLVDWVNTHVEPGASLPSSSPTLSRRSIDLQPLNIKLNRTLDGLRCSQLLNLSHETLQLRFALLKYLNLSLQHCLSLLDLRDTKSLWTIAYRLRQLSHCIFFDIKSSLVEAAIEATCTPTDTSRNSRQQIARITLDRMQALESRDDREVEPSVSECFFAQAFRQLHRVDPALLRRQIDSKGRLFSVKFRGEEGVDWGGVYREGATSMVDDLFSAHFNLFILCPNGQHDTGNNRGMYVPNPKCTSPVAMNMFAFAGQLLGISLRTHGDFPFMFPSLVWKQLLGQTPSRADLEDTDAMFTQMLDGIANCEKDGISTEAEFATAFAGLELRFTASSCTGEEMELVPNGRHMTVEFQNRLEYCRLAELARLEECRAQIEAMAQGFATLFPRRVLTLLTWQELEILACGSPKIDLELWQRHTRYDGYTEDDPTVLLFWEALAEFSDAQRADFVRFAWGRSRLPRGKWPQPFKLSKKGGRDAIRSLPVAHTCFFSVELPPYTSRETMRSMLLATITFGLGGILMA